MRFTGGFASIFALYIYTNDTLARNELFRCLLHSNQLYIIDCNLLSLGYETHNENTNKYIFSLCSEIHYKFL